MGTHKDVFIVLKKSLKWVPILGWVSANQYAPQAVPMRTQMKARSSLSQGMQFYTFIFLARSWA